MGELAWEALVALRLGLEAVSYLPRPKVFPLLLKYKSARFVMARMADDIEEYLVTDRQERAIRTLFRRRKISLRNAGKQISMRMFDILIELYDEAQDRRGKSSGPVFGTA